MEPREYATLFREEERHFWYRALHRLAEESLRRALAGPARPDERPPAPLGPASLGAGASAPSILDAGCGTGGFLRRLAPWTRAIGLDGSPLALGPARERSTRPLVRGSVTALPFRDGALDGIVSLDVLYHRGVESDTAALREFRRCLRPGGVLVLNLPAYESLRSSHDAAIHTARRYRRAPLRALLLEAGLAPLRVTHWNSLLFPALALVRAWRRRRPPDSAAGESDLTGLPTPINAALGLVLALERGWLRIADLPFGLSLLAVARRPAEAGAEPA